MDSTTLDSTELGIYNIGLIKLEFNNLELNNLKEHIKALLTLYICHTLNRDYLYKLMKIVFSFYLVVIFSSSFSSIQPKINMSLVLYV